MIKKGIIKSDKLLIIMLIIIGIESLILFVGSTTAVFITSKNSNQQDMYKTGDLSIAFAEDTTSTISLTNQYPMSDEAGKKQEPYTFTITNNGSYNTVYTIQLNDVTTALKHAIKYQINGSSPQYISAGNTINVGTLMPGEKKTFNLRLWIDSRSTTSNKGLSYSGKISVSGQASKIPYFVDNSGANTPELADGMIPVVYDGVKDKWVVADQTKGWYNYSDQVWANAVTVSDASLRNATSGTELPMEKINTMWVWIPKYKYKMFNTTGTKTEQEISIVFDSGCQILGDVNQDGKVTEEDKIILMNFISGESIEYTETELLERADMDNDGNISGLDATILLRVKEGLEPIKCANAKPCGLLGDINLDGFVDSEDQTIISNYSVNQTGEYTKEEMLERADMNNDGAISFTDAQLVTSIISGKGQNACPGNVPEEQTNRGTVSCVEGTSTSEICEDTENSMVADGISTYTHPAFTFGEEEINGFWVGKFETGVDNNSTCYSSMNEANCNTSNLTPIIKPDIISLRYQSISNQFLTALKFGNGTMNASTGEVTFSANSSNVYGLNVTSNTTDTHMMKNTEWGAVAYLSQSRVGKYGNDNYTGANKEIYINNSSSMYTGRSDGAPGSSSVSYSAYGTYSYNDKTCSSSTCIGSINTSSGQGASTTGTIYGIYDMSGGESEYVMGNWNGNSGQTSSKNSGFSGKNAYDGSSTSGISFPESKYYNKYIGTSSTTTTKEKSILGDATLEVKGWYSDSSGFVYNTFPWFVRGGSSSSSSSAGIFNFSNHTGGAYDNSSEFAFRSVLIP